MRINLTQTATSLFVILLLVTAHQTLHGQDGALLVRNPTGGERVIAGSTLEIQWQSYQVDGVVQISLWDGDNAEWHDVAAGVNVDDKKFTWIVPGYLRGDKFRVKVQSVTTPEIYAFSPTFFRILEGSGQAGIGGLPGATTQDISLSPNPVDDILRVNWLGNANPAGLRILDVFGSTMIEMDYELTGMAVVPTADLVTGMYLLELTYVDGTIKSQKFLVQH